MKYTEKYITHEDDNIIAVHITHIILIYMTDIFFLYMYNEGCFTFVIHYFRLFTSKTALIQTGAPCSKYKTSIIKL